MVLINRILSFSLLAAVLFQQDAMADRRHHFEAQPGSRLAAYEHDLKFLIYEFEGAKHEMVIKILKTYFGFDEVQFASTFNRTRERQMAYNIAIQLKDILPAVFPLHTYMRVDQTLLDEPNPTEFVESTRIKQIRILRFDRDVAGIDLSVDVRDGLEVDDAYEPGQKVRERIETYKLTVGGARFMILEENLKAWVSMLNNYSYPFGGPDFDFH